MAYSLNNHSPIALRPIESPFVYTSVEDLETNLKNAEYNLEQLIKVLTSTYKISAVVVTHQNFEPYVVKTEEQKLLENTISETQQTVNLIKRTLQQRLEERYYAEQDRKRREEYLNTLKLKISRKRAASLHDWLDITE